MPTYAILALLAAVGISAYAILTKVILRYRICSAAYVAFATGTAAAIPCVIALTLFGPGLPRQALVPLAVATLTGFGALYAAARATQEGDPSTIVPVMGLKIPFVAVLSVYMLGQTQSWQVYLAAALATIGVVLFSIGPQEKSQGSHGYQPIIGILWAAASAALYAFSDIYIRRCLVFIGPVPLAMWNYTLIGLLCAVALFRPSFHQYKVKALDVALLFANGLCLLLSVMAFFASIAAVGQVTTPNIVFATRGFITIGIGYVLGKMLKVPFERQPAAVYLLRILGAAALFAGIFLAI